MLLDSMDIALDRNASKIRKCNHIKTSIAFIYLLLFTCTLYKFIIWSISNVGCGFVLSSYALLLFYTVTPVWKCKQNSKSRKTKNPFIFPGFAFKRLSYIIKLLSFVWISSNKVILYTEIKDQNAMKEEQICMKRDPSWR